MNPSLEAMKQMSPEQLEKVKHIHLQERNENKDYQLRGISFIDMGFEPKGRPRYDIKTADGSITKWITIHVINHMLGINKQRKPRKGVSQAQHDRDLAERLRNYVVTYASFCKYIEANNSNWNF